MGFFDRFKKDKNKENSKEHLHQKNEQENSIFNKSSLENNDFEDKDIEKLNCLEFAQAFKNQFDILSNLYSSTEKQITLPIKEQFHFTRLSRIINLWTDKCEDKKDSNLYYASIIVLGLSNSSVNLNHFYSLGRISSPIDESLHFWFEEMANFVLVFNDSNKSYDYFRSEIYKFNRNNNFTKTSNKKMDKEYDLSISENVSDDEDDLIISDKSVNSYNTKNFKYLDDLIHSGMKEINLESDIIIHSEEEFAYANGIKIDLDNIIINGNGYKISVKQESKIPTKVRIFDISAKGIILKNITFVGGYHDDFGGAIYNEKDASLKIRSCEFRNNIAKNGGAITNLGDLEIYDSIFEKNYSKDSGGAISNQNESLKIFNSKFYSNKSDMIGGAILNYGQMEIFESNFDDNSSHDGGSINNQSEGSLKIINSMFSNNFANSYGGVIFNWGEINIIDSHFDKNHSKNMGGAIFNEEGFLDISNSRFLNNYATTGVIYSKGILRIFDGFFTNNYSKEAGGVIYSENNAEIKNSKFIENYTCGNKSTGGAIISDAPIDISFCEFRNNKSIGGILASAAELKINNSKFYNNEARYGALFLLGKTIINECEFNETKSTFGVIMNRGKLELNKSIFNNNVSEENISVLNNDDEAYITDCKFFKNKGVKFCISNYNIIKFNNSTFIENDVESIIFNEKNSTTFISYTKFIRNKLINSTIINQGLSCNIYESIFENNKLKINKESGTDEIYENIDNQSCVDIYNETQLVLNKIKFKYTSDEYTVLNKGHIELKQINNKDVEIRINNEGKIEKLDSIQSNEEINTLNNFKDFINSKSTFTHLDNQIHKDIKCVISENSNIELASDIKIYSTHSRIIHLDSDIKLNDFEIDFYEGGIELNIDNLIIEGNGKSIDANNKSRIFTVNAKNITLKNIIFKNANLFDNFNFNNIGGGAIRILKDCSLNMINCQFYNTLSNNNGGVLFNRGLIKSFNCLFKNNKSDSLGGVIYNEGIYISIKDEFNQNSSKLGAIFYNHGILSISTPNFVENISILSKEIENYLYDYEILINDLDKTLKEMDQKIHSNNNLKSEIEFDDNEFTDTDDLISSNKKINFENDLIFNVGLILMNESELNNLKHLIYNLGKINNSFNDNFNIFTLNKPFEKLNSQLYTYIAELNELNTSSKVNSFSSNNFKFLNDLIKESNEIFLKENISFNYKTDQEFYNGIIIDKEEDMIIDGNGFFIDACGVAALFNIKSTKKVSFKNLVFLNSYSFNTSIIKNNSNLSFENCIFDNNNPRNEYSLIENHNQLYINNSIFINNSSTDGHLINNKQNLYILNSNFIDNYSKNISIINNDLFSNLNIKLCDFINNYSDYKGRLIKNKGEMNLYCSIILLNHFINGTPFDNKGYLNLFMCKLIKNSSITDASIINNHNKLTLLACLFDGNHSLRTFGLANSGDLSMIYSKFINNQASTGLLFSVGFLELNNNEFSYNTVDNSGVIFINKTLKDSFITNSKFSNNQCFKYGLIFLKKGILNIEHCEFNENISNIGSAISNESEGILKLEDSLLDSNYSEYGGAIYNKGKINIITSNFLSNTVKKEGGAIFSEGGFVKICNSKFENNKSEGNGGAINSSNNIEIIKSTFLKNSAKGLAGGGAIIISSADLDIKNSEFKSNKNIGYGGGAISNFGTLNLENTNFISNESSIGAAAVYNEKNILNVSKCGFIDNKSLTGFDPIFLDYNKQNIDFKNCKFKNNTPKDY